jgi:hypothetical protein
VERKAVCVTERVNSRYWRVLVINGVNAGAGIDDLLNSNTGRPQDTLKAAALRQMA